MNLADKQPNFYIIGAAKAGTTSLYDILRQHPQVYLPFDKEPAFFCDDDYYRRGDAWYLRTYFEQSNGQPRRGEATSRYLYFGEKVAPRILAFSGSEHPSFIAIFRDPAKLVYSFYWNSIREGVETLPFESALRAEPERMGRLQMQLERRGQILYAYSQVGSYARQIQHFLERFATGHFLYLLTEDLADFPELVRKLQVFLGLEDYSAAIDAVRSNDSALPRSGWLHQLLRRRSVFKEVLKPLISPRIRSRWKTAAIEKNLRSFTPPEMDSAIQDTLRRQFAEETRRLQDIIQRDLSAWLPA